MHKIKLKLKKNQIEPLVFNLKRLNFNFEKITEDGIKINIIFYSQYQIERLLNITNLKKYDIKTFVENFPTEKENHYKIAFLFSFCVSEIEFICNKLDSHLKPK